MLVNVRVNRLIGGSVQSFVAKPQASPNPVQTYASIDIARGVLLDFGIDEREVDSTLKLLPEIGPRDVLRFSAINVAQNLLEKHGFTF